MREYPRIRLSCLSSRFYGLQSRISRKITSHPAKISLKVIAILFKILSAYCA